MKNQPSHPATIEPTTSATAIPALTGHRRSETTAAPSSSYPCSSAFIRGYFPRPCRRAFTLVEILVVITIIAALIGAVTVSLSMIRGQAKVKQAQSMLEHLKAAETEYRAETGFGIGLPSDPSDYSWPNAVPNGARSIYYFMDKLHQVPKAYKQAQAVGKPYIKAAGTAINSDDQTPRYAYIIDPWDHPIQYRSYFNSNGNDPYLGSGKNLPQHGSRLSPHPFFASAGPDGKWGHTDPDTNAPDKDAKDNIYSFTLLKGRTAH